MNIPLLRAEIKNSSPKRLSYVLRYVLSTIRMIMSNMPRHFYLKRWFVNKSAIIIYTTKESFVEGQARGLKIRGT